MIRTTRGQGRGKWGLRLAGVATAVGATAAGLLVAAPAQAEPVAVASGSLDWGIRSSFRSYITGPIAHGTIAVSEGATQNSGNGTFVFPGATGSVDGAANTATINYGGKVKFTGHDGQLDLELSNPSVTVSGSTGTLSAKMTSKSLSTGTVTDFGTVPVVTFAVGGGSALAASTVVNGTGGKLTSQGVAAFSNFYEPPSNDFVDDFRAAATLSSTPDPDPDPDPDPEPGTPTVAVSKTVVSAEGETVTVTGTGFDPNAAIGTRPPLNAKPAGVYVAFGTFLDTWRPSAGAPSSSRKTGPQATSVRWAVPEADRATVGQATSVTLNPNGSFSADIFVQRDFAGALAEGNYGIYTYPGSGAVAASYETYTPLTFVDSTAVTASQTISTTVLDNLGLSISVANTTVTLPSPTLSTDGQWLETSGAINSVQVTDLRATNPGWNLSGQATDFANGTNTAPAAGLGWTPSVVSSSAGQTVAPGAAVVPNVGGGLSAASVLASSAAGAGRGYTTVGAGLLLRLPAVAVPGTYTSTLTLTAI